MAGCFRTCLSNRDVGVISPGPVPNLSNARLGVEQRARSGGASSQQREQSNDGAYELIIASERRRAAGWAGSVGGRPARSRTSASAWSISVRGAPLERSHDVESRQETTRYEQSSPVRP